MVPTESASVCELIRVAEGRVGAALMRQFHGHDTAIAAALLEALGGVVMDGSAAILCTMVATWHACHW
jgi:fructose-1,6-bisphosphatase/inositol monophosphatase family enzyme